MKSPPSSDHTTTVILRLVRQTPKDMLLAEALILLLLYEHHILTHPKITGLNVQQVVKEIRKTRDETNCRKQLNSLIGRGYVSRIEKYKSFKIGRPLIYYTLTTDGLRVAEDIFSLAAK